MYCRKCLKEGKKISMNTEIDDQRYICPRCSYIVNWKENIDNKEEN